MSKASWTRLARADLAGIDKSFAARDPAYADRVGRTAIKTADFLAETAFAGEEVTPDHRRWHVTRTPYLLICRVVPDGVECVRVWHERQNWRSQSL